MQIDEDMEKHDKLLKEIQDNPTDLNAIVAKRRKDFTGDFFRYLALLSETCDSLEDRDGNYESTWDCIILMDCAHCFTLNCMVRENPFFARIV